MKKRSARIMTALPRRPRTLHRLWGERVSLVVAPSGSHVTEASVDGDDVPDP